MSRFAGRTRGSSLVAGWSRPRLVKSVQRFTIALGSGVLTNTATINEVVPENCLLIYNGNDSTDSSQDNPSRSFARLVFTNGTTITALRESSTSTVPAVNGAVVEFAPGVLLDVQRGTVAIANGNASGTLAINAVDTSLADLIPMGRSTDINATELATNRDSRVRLSSSVQVTHERNGTAGAVTAGTQVVKWGH